MNSDFPHHPWGITNGALGFLKWTFTWSHIIPHYIYCIIPIIYELFKSDVLYKQDIFMHLFFTCFLV